MDQMQKTYELKFEGTGKEYFGVLIVNWLLTALTLGIYYPWARAKKLKYLYGVTSLDGNRFSFHGEGKEMFIGMLKFFLVLALFFFVLNLFIWMGIPVLGFIIFYLAFIALLPLLLHGSLRYRLSRTTLRGIRFGYRGDRKQLTIDFIKNFLLTLVTFGVYAAWMQINLRKYIIGHIRYGEVEGRYKGEGLDLFLINLKGVLLSILTLGIYSFWWQKDIIAYMIDNASFHRGEDSLKMQSTFTGGGLLKLTLVNMLIAIFTLGLGFAWIEVRTLKYITEHIKIAGNLDLGQLSQTEEEYKDALGEDALDFFDFDLF